MREVVEGEDRKDGVLDLFNKEDKEDDEFDRGAETGITTPLFFKAERENLGAAMLEVKSTSRPFFAVGSAGTLGVGAESAHKPDADRLGGGLFAWVGGE